MGKVRGEWGLPFDVFAGIRVKKAQAGGMERLSSKVPECCGELWACPCRYFEAAAVNRVADQRIVDVGHVDADLMGAPGFQHDVNQGMSGKSLGQPVMRDCRLAAGADDGKAFAIHPVPADGLVDAAAAGHGALAKCDIFTVDRPLLKLVDQYFMGLQGFCHHQQAASVLVDAVDDAAARHTREGLAVIEQGVLEGAVRMAGSRMYDQPGGLFDNDDGVVLMDNAEGDVLRCDLSQALAFRAEADLLPPEYPVLCR